MENSNEKKNFVALSDVGKIRTNNEDAAFAASSQYGGLLVVADGMGGHRKGEVAAQIVVDTLSQGFAAIRHPLSLRSGRRFARRCVKKANRHIYKMSLQDEYKEMGTTVVVAVIAQEGAYILSIGDSRCYSYAESTGLNRNTTDETYVQLLFESGKISKEEIASNPEKNLLINAVGIVSHLSVIQETVLRKDQYDTLLLCSDGLYNMVSDSVIAGVLQETGKITDEKGKALISLALQNGGKDNVAVALWDR